MMTTNWPDYDIAPTEPTDNVTPKDVYAVKINGKPSALCISCCAGLDVEFKQRHGDDWVVERPCQGCGERQRRLL